MALTGFSCWTAIAAFRSRLASAFAGCRGAPRSILKALCPKPLAVAQQQFGRALEVCLAGGLAVKRCFRRRIAPRLVRHAAQRQPRALMVPPSSSSAAAIDTSANA